MPGSATLYTQGWVLTHTLAIQVMPAPIGTFVGLTTTAPDSINRGTEVAGGGYLRQNLTFALQSPPNGNVAANTATVEFPAATATWGAIGWFEIWDVPLGLGNRLYWGPLVDPSDGVTPITRTVLSGDIIRFQAGVLQVSAT